MKDIDISTNKIVWNLKKINPKMILEKTTGFAYGKKYLMSDLFKLF